jgi:hypothetical protein
LQSTSSSQSNVKSVATKFSLNVPTYIDPRIGFKTNDIIDINAELPAKTKEQIFIEQDAREKEQRIKALTKRNLEENITYQNILVKKKAKELGYTDDNTNKGITAVQKYFNDNEERIKEDYLDKDQLKEVRDFETYQVFKQQGKEKEANEALKKYLDTRSAYRKGIDDQIVNLKGKLAVAKGDDALLIKATIGELEAKKQPFYEPKKQMDEFINSNQDEIAAVSKPTETAQDKLKKYIAAQDNLVQTLRGELGLSKKSNTFQRFTEEWNVLSGYVGNKEKLDFLHIQELKLKNAVQILELNRTPLDKDSAWGVFGKEFVQNLITPKAGTQGVDNVIAGNVLSIVKDAGIENAANQKQVETAKFASNPYQFGSGKWFAQNIAPTVAVITEMIPATMLTEGLGTLGSLSKISRPMKILMERGSLGKAGNSFFQVIQTNKYGRGLLKAAANGVNYGIQSAAVTTLAPQLKDEMGFTNGLFAGAVGSALGQVSGKIMETSLKSIARLFGNKSPEAISVIEKYGSIIAKSKEFSDKVAGETAEEYVEQLTAIYKESKGYNDFIYNVQKHYETTPAIEEFATILMMSIGAPAGSTLGKSLFNASKKAYNNLTAKERETASQIADELNNEETLATEDAINETVKEEKVVVPSKSEQEQDTIILEKQKELGLETKPELVLSDIGNSAMDKMNNGEVLTLDEIKTLSNELYARYNGIKSIKEQEGRRFTIEQIDSTLNELETNITLLENTKNRLLENEETETIVKPIEQVDSSSTPILNIETTENLPATEQVEENKTEEVLKALPKEIYNEIDLALQKESVSELIKEGKIKYIDSVTKESCLRYGGRGNTFNRGSKWEIVKDLKGYKTHEKGGVDLSIGKNGVEVRSGKSKFYAKKGLLFSDSDPIEKRIAPTFSEKEAAKIKEQEKFLSDFIKSKKYKEMLLKQYGGDEKLTDENIKKRLEQLELTKYDNTLLNEKTGTYEKDKFVPYFDSGIHPSAFTVVSEEDKKLTQGDVYLPSNSFTSMYDVDAQKNDLTNLGGYALSTNVPTHEMTHRTLGVNDENITPYAKEKIKNIMAGTSKFAEDMGNKKGVNPDTDPTGLGAKNENKNSNWQQPTEVLARLNSFRKLLVDNKVYDPNTQGIDKEKYNLFKKTLKDRYDVLDNISLNKITEEEKKELEKIIDIDSGLRYMNDTIFKNQKPENDEKIMWMLNNLVKNETKGGDYNV